MVESTRRTAMSRPLRLLNLYRVVASGVLFVVVLGGETPGVFGGAEPRLFVWAAGIYLAFAIAFGITLRISRPAPHVQMYVQLVVDVVAITVLAYASGGARSGLGGLMFVPVATASQLAPRRYAILLAAIATLAMLGAEVYAQLAGTVGTRKPASSA